VSGYPTSIDVVATNDCTRSISIIVRIIARIVSRIIARAIITRAIIARAYTYTDVNSATAMTMPTTICKSCRS
jgi:hypothetical protein